MIVVAVYAQQSVPPLLVMATTFRAAVFGGSSKGLVIKDVDVNHPALGEVLVRNHAVAVQPLDAKMLIAGYGPAAALRIQLCLEQAAPASSKEWATPGAAIIRVPPYCLAISCISSRRFYYITLSSSIPQG